MNKKLPIVAIVGRTNVGKSSLFNRLVGWQQAIVARESGTTRDSVVGQVQYTPTKQQASASSAFWLVDTAGLKDPEDDFEATIQEQIDEATSTADLILVVVEAGTQASHEDRTVAKKALRSKKPTILIINKSDTIKNQDSSSDWLSLGISDIISTSATQNRGTANLLDKITAILPHKTRDENEATAKIALLGRPNVGKSQLFNSLAKKQQAIVANLAGTTRDVNTVNVSFYNQTIQLLDTAGIRRSGKIERGIEKFSVLRSLQAIDAADVCLLLIDVNELATALDQKIAGMIKEAGKGLIIVVSKWDSLEDKDPFSRDKIAAKLTHVFDFVPWAPLIFTSAVTGQNVTKIFDMAIEIKQRRDKYIKTTELNKWLRMATAKHLPAGGKQPAKLRYIVQDANDPPTFRIYGSHSRQIHWSYRRYLERKLREDFDLVGTPIKIYFIDEKSKVTDKSKQDRLN